MPWLNILTEPSKLAPWCFWSPRKHPGTWHLFPGPGNQNPGKEVFWFFGSSTVLLSSKSSSNSRILMHLAPQAVKSWHCSLQRIKRLVMVWSNGRVVRLYPVFSILIMFSSSQFFDTPCRTGSRSCLPSILTLPVGQVVGPAFPPTFKFSRHGAGRPASHLDPAPKSDS